MNTNETNLEFFNKNSNDNHEIVTHDSEKNKKKKIIIITISAILAILLIIGMVFGIIAAVGGKEEQYPIGNGDEVFNTKNIGKIDEKNSKIQHQYEKKYSWGIGDKWKISLNLNAENLINISKKNPNKGNSTIKEIDNLDISFIQSYSFIGSYEEDIQAKYLFFENIWYYNKEKNIDTYELNFYLKNFTYLYTSGENEVVLKEISIDNFAFECLFELDYKKQLLNLTIVENVNNLKVDDEIPLSFNLKASGQTSIPSTSFDDIHYDFNKFYDEKFHFNFI